VTRWLRGSFVGGAVATPPLLQPDTFYIVRSILALKGSGGRAGARAGGRF
jgi:hypothetical protein